MIVSVKNLTKHYGSLLALDDFSMEVYEGEIFGLLGPNGSGKTTAINCLLSLLHFEKGNIELFGQPMSPVAYEIKRNIGIVLQNVAVFQELTVIENIDYFCGLYIPDKAKRKELVQEAIHFVGLNEFSKFYPKKLSGGLLRRLNIACGIAHKPKLIILDEPTVAVDPQSRNRILEGIMDLNKQGATVIYTSHYMEEVEQICSRIAIMDKGRIIASGTKEQLKSGIRLEETVRIETPEISGLDLDAIHTLPGTVSAEHQDGQLIVRFEKSGNNLMNVLNLMQKRGLPYTRAYLEMPTLNDVFLEITGKELRD
jgi:ABC-2 type transport system ATP-binding protein